MKGSILLVFAVASFYGFCECFSHENYGGDFRFASPEHLFSRTRFHRTTSHHRGKRRHHVHASHQHHVKATARQGMFGNGFGNVLGNGFGNGLGNRFGNGLEGCMNPCSGDEARYALGSGTFNPVNQFEDGTAGCCDSPRFTGRMRSTNNFHKVVIQSNQFHPNNPLHYTMPGRNYFEPTKHVYDNSPIRHVQSNYAPAFEEQASSVVAPTQNVFSTVQRLCRPPILTNPGCNPNAPIYSGDVIPPVGAGPAVTPLGAGPSVTNFNNMANAGPNDGSFTPVFGSTFMANSALANLGSSNNVANLGSSNNIPFGGNRIAVGAASYQMPEKCLPPVTCFQNNNGFMGGKEEFLANFPATEAKNEGSDLALPRNPFLRRYIPKLLGTIFQTPSRRHLKHSHHHKHHAKHVLHDE